MQQKQQESQSSSGEGWVCSLPLCEIDQAQRQEGSLVAGTCMQPPGGAALLCLCAGESNMGGVMAESTEPRREEIPGAEICCERVYSRQGSQGRMPWGLGYTTERQSLCDPL